VPQDATFKLHNPRHDLVVDGSFITAVHFVAGNASLPASTWDVASFHASRLNEFNTGTDVINGTCDGRPFVIGMGYDTSCSDLHIEMKFSSAIFKFREEWAVTVRGNTVYGHISGPAHRLDVSFSSIGDAAQRSLPHGIVGQSFSNNAPRVGKLDSYPKAGRFATSAMAEGAIDGEAAMYQVTQPFDIDFVFSRFRAAVLTAPVGGILPGKASSTEQNLPVLLN